jgi:two-component system, chemotaxis family, CheB/CheR fusion protein
MLRSEWGRSGSVLRTDFARLRKVPMSTSDEPRTRAQAIGPRLIVGIGASAGGLHACKQVLERMPRNSGMAFVIVVHLDPVRHSHLAELLQAVTEMEVAQVTSSLAVKPDHVYVIAPNTELTLRAGVLEPTPARAPYGSRATIDHFFASLAADQGERAAAVVLSGTGCSSRVSSAPAAIRTCASTRPTSMRKRWREHAEGSTRPA